MKDGGQRPGPLLAGPAPLAPASQRKRTRLRAFLYAIAAPCLVGLAKLFWASVRVRRVEGAEHLDRALAAEGPIVLCFWHDELFPGLMWLRRRFRRAGRQMAFMVSPSVDGDLAARMLAIDGGVIVRGSATRSGVKSLRDLYRVMRKQGASPVVLPDGPQGPPREMKEGALLLSHLAGAPILCLAAAGTRPWRLRTWDRLQVPRPFSRYAFAVGELRPPEAAGSGEGLERARVALQAEMDELGERARRLC